MADEHEPRDVPAEDQDDDAPPEWKLNFAISMVNNWGVLGEPPSDPRVTSVILSLNDAIYGLALAHIQRLRGERGWKKTAKKGWQAARSVEKLVVLNHDTPPFDALGSIELAVEAVADALLNASGQEQEEKRRMAVEWAKLAEERLKERPAGPYASSAARGALLLSEGSFATKPPGF